jgi:hypothetical protein
MSPTPLGPRHQTNPTLGLAISIGQLFVLIAGVGGVFMTIGRRDELLSRQDRDITDLRAIAGDLVKAQVLGAANDQKHAEAIAAIGGRLDRLEAKR